MLDGYMISSIIILIELVMFFFREDFEYLADICFKYFGNRVKNWVTFNEPNVLMFVTYRSGMYPPCHCSSPFGNCTNGDSKSEPLIAAHNIILSHAAAVNLYRTKYQVQAPAAIIYSIKQAKKSILH